MKLKLGNLLTAHGFDLLASTSLLNFIGQHHFIGCLTCRFDPIIFTINEDWWEPIRCENFVVGTINDCKGACRFEFCFRLKWVKKGRAYLQLYKPSMLGVNVEEAIIVLLRAAWNINR